MFNKFLILNFKKTRFLIRFNLRLVSLRIKILNHSFFAKQCCLWTWLISGGTNNAQQTGWETYAIEQFFLEYFTVLNFIPYYILLIAMCLFIFICLLLIVSALVSPQVNDFEKQSPYECGFEPFGEAHNKFNVHFYIVAILFLLFDLEILVFLLWIFSVIENSFFFTISFNSMLLFYVLLGVGLFYEWLVGALQWHKKL